MPIANADCQKSERVIWRRINYSFIDTDNAEKNHLPAICRFWCSNSRLKAFQTKIEVISTKYYAGGFNYSSGYYICGLFLTFYNFQNTKCQLIMSCYPMSENIYLYTSFSLIFFLLFLEHCV